MENEVQHRPCESFDVDGRWCTPCVCGQKFTASTPTGAYGKCAKHVETATKKSAPTGASNAEPHTTPARAKHCGCGCGEPLAVRAGGLFRSGHDARFKSILTAAHAEGRQVSHPMYQTPDDAMSIAKWLDERRGVGSFWQDKVAAGHKPKPEHTPRPIATPTEEERIARSHARVDALMEFNATRRPASGDMGHVTLRDGSTFGAQVLRRTGEEALSVRFLDGPKRNVEVVVRDHQFKKAKKLTDV